MHLLRNRISIVGVKKASQMNKYSSLLLLSLISTLSYSQRSNSPLTMRLAIQTEWYANQDYRNNRDDAGFSFFNGAAIGLSYRIINRQKVTLDLGLDYNYKSKVFRKSSSPFSDKFDAGKGRQYHYLTLPATVRVHPTRKISPFIEASFSKLIFSGEGNSGLNIAHPGPGWSYLTIAPGAEFKLNSTIHLIGQMNFNAYNLFSATRWSYAPRLGFNFRL